MPAPLRVALRKLLLAAPLAVFASSAIAAGLWPDSVFGTVGYTSGAFVAIYGAGASWDLKERLPARDDTGFGFRIDGQVSYWLGKGQPTPYQHVWDFSVTPVARWTFSWFSTPRVYVEGGIGFHGLSATRINNDRMFGSAFQFGEMVGVGATFGPRNDYDVKLYFQHVSNGGLAKENWGLSYPGIAVRVALP